jgi:hypothetical protein
MVSSSRPRLLGNVGWVMGPLKHGSPDSLGSYPQPVAAARHTNESVCRAAAFDAGSAARAGQPSAGAWAAVLSPSPSGSTAASDSLPRGSISLSSTWTF